MAWKNNKWVMIIMMMKQCNNWYNIYVCILYCKPGLIINKRLTKIVSLLIVVDYNNVTLIDHMAAMMMMFHH